MPTSSIVLLILAALAWVLLCLDLRSVVGVIESGDRRLGVAIGWLFACVLTGGIWCCVGWLLWTAGRNGRLAGRMMVVSAVVGVLAAAASFGALHLLNSTGMRWPLLFLAAPPVLALYAALLLRGVALSNGIHMGVWALAAALPVSVFAGWAWENSLHWSPPVSNAGWQQHWNTWQAERRRQRLLAELEALPPDAPLAAWPPLAHRASGVRREAIEKLRKNPRRQSEFEHDLSSGRAGIIDLVPEVDLELTPELCTGADWALKEIARRIQDEGDEVSYTKDEELEHCLPAVHWLQARGCDCTGGLQAIENALRERQPTPARREALAELARLRQKS